MISSAEGVDSRHRWFHSHRAAILIVVLAALAAYANTLANGFVFDDIQQVVRNRWITDVRNLPEIFSTHVAGFDDTYTTSYYRPLMYVFFMLTHLLFGPEAWAFHMVNLLFHAANCGLVYLVTARLVSHDRSASSGRFVPFAAALLFAVHPIHTEAVDWVSAIPDLSSTFFVLLALDRYIVFRRAGPGARGHMVLAVASFFMAMLCKETAIALLIIVPLYDFLFDRSPQPLGDRIGRWTPFVAAAGIYIALRLWALRGFAPGNRAIDLSGWECVLNIFPVIAKYVEKLFIPIGLSARYDFQPVHSIGNASVLLGVALVAGTIALAVRCRESRTTLFGLGLLVVTLLPALYIPAVDVSVIAERYLYLPSVGFVLLIALALERTAFSFPRARGAVPIVLACVAAVLLVATVSRNAVWREGLTLWSDAVRKSPGSASAHRNFGYALYARGLIDRSIEHYRISLDLDDSNADTFVNLGAAHALRGEQELAARAYRSALQLRGDHAEAHTNLGLALVQMGQVDEGLAECEIAASLKPDLAEAHHNLGIALARKGAIARAVTEFGIAVRLAPENSLFRENLERAIRLRDQRNPTAGH